MLTVAVPKRNKLPNIIVLTPKDGPASWSDCMLCRFSVLWILQRQLLLGGKQNSWSKRGERSVESMVCDIYDCMGSGCCRSSGIEYLHVIR